MKFDEIKYSNTTVPVICLNTAIIGTGAAGYNAAVKLYDLGQKDIAIFTEGKNMGTSRNTGSDKQTYYKLSLEGKDKDSIADMAKTYYKGGSMHGDIALVEAALSARAYFYLVEIGVPFPHNKYGEYVGYKTDHDPKKRATSAGPLTSRFMTEKLEKQAEQRSIKLFDRLLVIKLLTREINHSKKKVIGFIALDLSGNSQNKTGLVCVNCTNVILATGGPAGMYESSVYPLSHNGSNGIAFLAGCKGVNLTESQYGIASKKFRWNLSGTYQQVIPRYISTKTDGTDEREFLNDYFSSSAKLFSAIFLKGYQWPFDPRKIDEEGSSLIDLLVYNETQIKGRKVYLDFIHDPDKFEVDCLNKEAYEYLEKSGALIGKPIERLKIMNSPAVSLYSNNGIDLNTEYLEIDVCAQHNNGGLMGNIWYESNVKNLFPVGEANGTFGVYRPGGSALNSTQVGSLRAAQYIAANYDQPPMDKLEFENDIGTVLHFCETIKSNKNGISIIEMDKKLKRQMTKYGAHIRDVNSVDKAIADCKKLLIDFENTIKIDLESELDILFRIYNNLISQFVYLSSIKEYLKMGGVSRGSYLITDPNGHSVGNKLPKVFNYLNGKDELCDKINQVELVLENDGYKIKSEWIKVRDIPDTDNWFENVWKDFRAGNIYHSAD